MDVQIIRAFQCHNGHLDVFVDVLWIVQIDYVYARAACYQSVDLDYLLYYVLPLEIKINLSAALHDHKVKRMHLFAFNKEVVVASRCVLA